MERVEDLAVVAELTDKALLSTQTAAIHVGTGKLDHFGEEGSQFPIYYLYRKWRREQKFKSLKDHGTDEGEHATVIHKPGLESDFCQVCIKSSILR